MKNQPLTTTDTTKKKKTNHGENESTHQRDEDT